MAEEQVQENKLDSVPEKKKRTFARILMIGLIAAVIAGAAGFYFYGKPLIGKDQQTQGQKKEKKKEIGPIVALEPFIINVSGNMSKYVKISVAIELNNEKAVEHTKKMTPVIRDMMLTVLGSKSPEMYMDVNGRTSMKKELYDGISGLFKGADLKAVYITDIIMQ
jgi:flagellar protein FliL